MKKLARRTSPCPACGAPIECGAPLAPLLGDNGRIRWVHPACAPAGEQPCPHWVRCGVCHLGDRCALTHPPLDKTLPGAFANAAFTKAGRVGVFRRFIVKEFGPLAGGVVDVAGGKGELAFELENLHDIDCVVVDPRAPMLDDICQRFRRFRARGFIHSAEEAVSDGFRRRWRAHEEGGAELELRRPRHLRLFFDGALVDWTALGGDACFAATSASCADTVDHSSVSGTTSGGDAFFAAAARRWTEQVLIGESSRKQNYAKVAGRLELLPPPPDVAPETDEWSAASARAALSAADLLAGLHCDGAAEPIIDFALAHGKAFAIVPCCTCSKQFPRRRNAQGGPVRSYDDLLAYLLAKDPRIKKTRLDFEGRDACLYFRP